MNNQELWQRYLDWLYFHEGLGFYLDVSRMNFGDDLVGKLEPKFNQAFKAMAGLEAGAIANPDENRKVGHYWLRDPELAPEAFRQDISDTLEQIEAFVEEIHTGEIRPPNAPKFTNILSIGIGGSALGPKFVAKALEGDFPPLNISFIDNTDPDGMDQILNRLKDKLASTLVIVISKSGGTAETRNGMLEVKHAFQRQGLTFSNHAIAITMSGSDMDVTEDCDHWLAKFAMYDWVGGRTSELSSVGLLAAALQGIDIRALLAGAREMDTATRVTSIKNNPAALLALCWYYARHGSTQSKNMVILPYKDRLVLFSRYLQQLVMESLGKELDKDGKVVHEGITVYGNKGSTDQHAYVQQLREGLPDFFATFIEVLEDRQGDSIEVAPGLTSGDYLCGLLQGTREALYEKQRESITITVPRVDARSVGALIALYERAVGYYASLVNINAYHQPGVEAGKKAASDFLALQTKILAVIKTIRQPLPLLALAEIIGAEDKVETIYKVVRHLAMNSRQVILHGNLGKPEELGVDYSHQDNPATTDFQEDELKYRKAS